MTHVLKTSSVCSRQIPDEFKENIISLINFKVVFVMFVYVLVRLKNNDFIERQYKLCDLKLDHYILSELNV